MSLSTRLTRQTARYISAAAMAALAMIMLAPAAQAQSVSVNVDDQSAVVGDTIAVPIEVSGLDQVPDGSDITSYGFDVDFGGSNVSYVGFEDAGTLSAAAGLTVDENASIPRIGAFGQNAVNDQADSGVLLYLQFEVTATGTSAVTLAGFEFNDGTPASDPAEPSFTVTGANNLVSFPAELSARESGEATPRDTVLVPVTTSDLTGEGVTAYGFDMAFNSNVVQPIQAIGENTVSSGFTVDGNTVSAGVFRIGAFGSSALEGSGTLVYIQMEVVGQGTSELSFVPGTFEFNDGTPAAATQDGTLDATGLDFTLGDPTMNGSVSALDASLVLRADLDLDTLSVGQQAAADVDADDAVTPNDASLILQSVVGLIDEFPAESSSSAAKTQAIAATGELEWGKIDADGGAQSIPVRLSGSVSGVQAISLTMEGDVGAFDMDGISDRLPEGWQLMHRRFEGDSEAKVVMAGASPITDAGEVLRLPIKDGETAPSVEATATINGAKTNTLGRAPAVDRPGSFALQGNFPNPVSQSTAITFDAPQSANVTVEVYDILGRRVLSTQGQRVTAGDGRSIEVDASSLGSGAYIYRVKAETDGQEAAATWTETGRMTVVK
jgi:hypothetical protein